MRIRTRFAPSPTGFLHIGSLRTALYAYALAKHEGGDFILRIEDTDRQRQVEGSIEAIKDILKKFGLLWDEFYIQSQRLEKYKAAATRLVESGYAFYCNCKPRNAKEGYSKILRDECRDKNLKSGAIRLKVPENKKLSYYDFVHKKEISWNSSSVYDATLLKSDGYPTYHLAVAVDDLDMGITHILRGHDWLPSTPIHILVFNYLGGKMPEIGHLTDILSGETGKKLSKRRDSVFVEDFLKSGYLPEALLNFVMLLGWAPRDNREIFTLQEFVKAFDVQGLQSANPRFFRMKLDWLNGEYIRASKDAELTQRILEFYAGKYPEEVVGRVLPLVKTRMTTLQDFEKIGDFFFTYPTLDASLFSGNYKEHLSSALEVIESLDEWSLDNLNKRLLDKVAEKSFKTGEFFMDLRIALTGKKITPPINDSIIILGREETIKRIKGVL
jgi:glutamyl-tRNA synthetase